MREREKHIKKRLARARVIEQSMAAQVITAATKDTKKDIVGKEKRDRAHMCFSWSEENIG